jgi:hypothetical protein
VAAAQAFERSESLLSDGALDCVAQNPRGALRQRRNQVAPKERHDLSVRALRRRLGRRGVLERPGGTGRWRLHRSITCAGA